MVKKRKTLPLQLPAAILQADLNIKDRDGCLQYLVQVFNCIRPRRTAHATQADSNLQQLTAQMLEQPQLLKNLRVAVTAQLVNTNLVPAFTESGLLLSRGFVQECLTRLNHAILPALQNESGFLYTINRIFYQAKDYIWVQAIQRAHWKAFFEALDLSVSSQNRELRKQLLQSLVILSHKVAHFGLEPEIGRYLSNETPEANPFVQQNRYLSSIQQQLAGQQEAGGLQDVALLYNLLEDCLACLAGIRETQSEQGTSLSLSYTMLVMESALMRMRILLDALDNNHRFNTDNLVDFFRTLVQYEKQKNSIRGLFSQSFAAIAYQVAEHKGSKGDKYITTTSAEYFKMIASAMWGGFIISFIAVFKSLLGKLPIAPFWQGLVYSMNYSAGFLLIEETHSTLATKQPAFTASAVAGSLDTRKNEQPNLYNLAITVARVTRSQFASFVGNLLVVFPFTYCLAWLYQLAFKHKLAEGEAAMHLLRDQHPWQSFALLYACNTGVFLFLSGLIAGFVQNKIQYGRVAERLRQHPVLKEKMQPRRLQQLAHYVETHAGGIAGNIALGLFLGMSTVVVKIFGIPFDIRHITISAGNTAIGVYGIGFHNMRWQYLCEVLAGVAGIGFLNFLVSFSLAFIVAVKSRGILLRDYPEFLRILFRYWRKYPLDFIRPRRVEYRAGNKE
ncbi:site-specific recombinase [Deminuibacter soli]|uniref:Recombinase n=1 Tax=Deminuibacter soli TaxID=2291815 RepID=A0A3E1NJE3_9BACT|nr:hypothetical protein [Deminuibacter soli]RFM28057.1 hypothetical protein DXN05_10995 [Deminuibacter soli]